MTTEKGKWSITCHLDPTFNQSWLRELIHDPVHPPSEQRNIERRIQKDRLVFVASLNGEAKVILQIALCRDFPCDAPILWTEKTIDPPFEYAIFYSIFKTPNAKDVQGMPTKLIEEAAKRIHRAIPSIKNFVTLSPIPSLSKKLPESATWQEVWNYVQANVDPVSKFHIGNGAKPVGVWPEADNATQRVNESHGWMASYEYQVA